MKNSRFRPLDPAILGLHFRISSFGLSALKRLSSGFLAWCSLSVPSPCLKSCADLAVGNRVVTGTSYSGLFNAVSISELKLCAASSSLHSSRSFEVLERRLSRMQKSSVLLPHLSRAFMRLEVVANSAPGGHLAASCRNRQTKFTKARWRTSVKCCPGNRLPCSSRQDSNWYTRHSSKPNAKGTPSCTRDGCDLTVWLTRKLESHP